MRQMRISEKSVDQIMDSYKAMADEARYRPAAPSDGMGTIVVPLKELDLEDEASRYVVDWWEQEDKREFRVGCCDFTTRPSTIYAIEASRNMCAGTAGREVALRLLKMAVRELENVMEGADGKTEVNVQGA